MYSQTTQGETPRSSETPLLVNLNGIPVWQAASGRTFPLVAGAEDPPPADAHTEDDGDDDAAESADSFDKDRAFRTIQKLRANEKVARERERAAARERDGLLAKQKQRDEAELSETERLKARTAELEREKAELERSRQHERTTRAIERAANRLGASDPEDVFKLLDQAAFDHDAEGNVTNADDLVKALLKQKPYLARAATAAGVPGTPRSNGQQTHEDRVKDNINKLKASGVYDPL